MPLSAQHREMVDLADEIASLASHIAAATAQWLEMVARFDEGQGWEGFRSCAEWLSWRCGIAPGTARDHVRVAHGLRTRPRIAEAFARGELSYSKVRALLRLDERFDEEQMLRFASDASAGQLERIVRGCQRADASRQSVEKKHAEREFGWARDEDGGVRFFGRLPEELGTLVVRALEACRDHLGPPPAEVPGDLKGYVAEAGRSVRARNADALVALAQTQLSERASSADVYQLVVHVDAAALPADSVSAETESEGPRLDDGTPLPHELARRLGCDASIVRMLERDGRTISMGRKTRTIPPALRRALRIRDNTCTFPGCSQRFHLDAHHLHHWADGGNTDLDNLVQLCRFHHRLMHEGGFSVKRRKGAFAYFDANGKQIPQAPRMPRGDCSSVQAPPLSTGRTRAKALSPIAPTVGGFDIGWTVESMFDCRAPLTE